MSENISTLSILLIEDEPADSKLLQATLRDEIQRGEVIIQTVRKLKVACEELKRFSFTCVLMDLGLPDGLGVEGVLKLREADPLVTIIVLTGLDDDRSAQKAIQLGAQEYLVKGRYDGPELLNLLRHAILRDHRLNRGVAPGQESAVVQSGEVPNLASRESFEDRGRQVLTASRVTQSQFAVCLFDVADFRGLHERHGAEIGEAIATRVAQVFAESARASDITARLGRNEFALLFSFGGNGDEIAEVTGRIVSRLESLKQMDGKPVSVTASVGVAQYPQHGDTLEILMQNAAVAREQIRGLGGGVLGVGAALPEVKVQQAQIRVKLDQAMGTDQFEVWCQPWLALPQAQPAGLEVLLRWQRSQKMLSPDEFLPVAENCGQIHGLGLSIARMACEHYRSWRQQGLQAGVLALNISLAELLDPEWLPGFSAVVKGAGLAGSDIQVELRSEALAEATRDLVMVQIRRLREAGVRVVLDQLDPSNISLGLVCSLPLDGIKTSRRLLRGVAAEGPDGAARRCLAGMLGLGRGLNLPVVVTGVETREDLLALKALGAEHMQGRLLCQPVRAAEWPARASAGFQLPAS